MTSLHVSYDSLGGRTDRKDNAMIAALRHLRVQLIDWNARREANEKIDRLSAHLRRDITGTDAAL